MRISRERTATSRVYVAIVIVVIAVAAASGLYLVYGTPSNVPGTTSSSSYTIPTTSSTASSATVAASSSTTQMAHPLIAYSADSYAAETQMLLNGFSSSTGVAIAPLKAAGSFADAKQIAAGAADDVFISSSLAATSKAYLKNLSSNWSIGFASDQFVVAYTNGTESSSTTASQIIAQGNAALTSNATADWNAFYASLSSGNVKVGIANPVTDPAGVRGWLVLEAAGKLYSAGGGRMAYVTPLLQAKANVTEPNAGALIAPLQAGQMQFILTYLSAAVGHHLNYLLLDRHINLGDPTLTTYYLRTGYQDSAGITVGAPIILSITIPLSSTNTQEALQFAQYVVKNAGTLSSYGLNVFPQAQLYSNVTPPQPIAQLISQGLIVEAGPLQ